MTTVGGPTGNHGSTVDGIVFICRLVLYQGQDIACTVPMTHMTASSAVASPVVFGVARLSSTSRLDTFPGNTHANNDPSESPLPSNHHTHNHPSANKHLALIPMSHTHPTAASSSSSSSSSPNFQLLINNALDTYKKRTKKDLRAHPLAAQVQACDSPAAIIAVLQQQVQGLDQSLSTDERWTKWFDPTIHVLLTFSQAVGTVGLV